MLCTRPDLAFSVSLLSRFISFPKEKHWRCILQLLKYIKTTKELSLVYSSLGDIKLIGYTDSDHGGNLDDRKSTSGFIFSISGCCISWKSSKQKTVAISSTEAEYVGLSTCVQEALWLRSLLKELGHNQKQTIIFGDNLSSMQIIKGGVSNRSKHIDVRHHFLRDHISNKEIDVQYQKSQDLCADFLTTAVNHSKHYQCMKFINLTS